MLKAKLDFQKEAFEVALASLDIESKVDVGIADANARIHEGCAEDARKADEWLHSFEEDLNFRVRLSNEVVAEQGDILRLLVMGFGSLVDLGLKTDLEGIQENHLEQIRSIKKDQNVLSTRRVVNQPTVILPPNIHTQSKEQTQRIVDLTIRHEMECTNLENQKKQLQLDETEDLARFDSIRLSKISRLHESTADEIELFNGMNDRLEELKVLVGQTRPDADIIELYLGILKNQLVRQGYKSGGLDESTSSTTTIKPPGLKYSEYQARSEQWRTSLFIDESVCEQESESTESTEEFDSSEEESAIGSAGEVDVEGEEIRNSEDDDLGFESIIAETF